MLTEIYVIGLPSKLGGADTELGHQIVAWLAMGIQVHIIPHCNLDTNAISVRTDLTDKGVIYHEMNDWTACKDKVVISYCNGQFLENIAEIKKYARTTLWVNCMTWLFAKEKEAHEKGLIDWFIYQTDHAREKVQRDLKEINSNYNWAKVNPYFNLVEFPYIKSRPDDKFRFGRISRPDTDKFAKFQMWVYETMTAPKLKEGMILGIDDRARNKMGGNIPKWIIQHGAGAIPAQDLYKFSECIIQACDTYENLPRVGFEAMSSGSMLIVDNRGGWKELVQHKQTGFLCNDDREFAYYSSRAAFETHERRQMIENARDWVVTNWGLEKAKESWGNFFARVEK
jgi:glycosyltransferase involved in cell wall biosynthesis